MPFAHLLRSGRPQVDPQAGNVTGFSSWVRELLWAKTEAVGDLSRVALSLFCCLCAFTACPARLSLKILARRPCSHSVGMFVVWELHVVRTCRGRGGWWSESCPGWWCLGLLWPQIAFRTWRHAIMRAEFSSFSWWAESPGKQPGAMGSAWCSWAALPESWGAAHPCVGRSGISAEAWLSRESTRGRWAAREECGSFAWLL